MLGEVRCNCRSGSPPKILQHDGGKLIPGLYNLCGPLGGIKNKKHIRVQDEHRVIYLCGVGKPPRLSAIFPVRNPADMIGIQRSAM